MVDAIRRHWPEYLIEGGLLGLFMISACAFATILEYPGSPVHQLIADPLLPRIFMGIAMGLSAIALIFSPWGKQSGAHINLSITMSFLRLGKVNPWDALFYVGSQFLGAVAGVLLAAAVLAALLAHSSVNYVATVPGSGGPASRSLQSLSSPSFSCPWSSSFQTRLTLTVLPDCSRVLSLPRT